MGRLPLEFVAAAKAAGHFLTTGLPLVVAAPLLGLMLNLDVAAFPALMLAMLAGAPALSFLGIIGAAGLTVGIRRGGLLASLLVLRFLYPRADFRRKRGAGSAFRLPGRRCRAEPRAAWGRHAGELRSRTGRGGGCAARQSPLMRGKMAGGRALPSLQATR